MRILRTVLFASGFSVLAMMLAGCGPGLLALAGGSGGGILGFGGKKEKKSSGSGGSLNTPPVVVVTSLTREDAPATISYTLIDAESNLCSVSVRYSLNGTTFFACTQATGGDGTTGLNSSGGGTSHTFEWDYEIDLLTEELVEGITIAITPTDGATAGVPGVSANLVDGNDAPVILTSPAAFAPVVIVNDNLVLVTFTLADTSSDIAGLVVRYTLDAGQTYTDLAAVDYVGTPPIMLLTSQSGASGQFIWDSAVALPSFVGSNVRLQLVPVDRPPGWTEYILGTPVTVGPIDLNNIAEGPPELEIVTSLLGNTELNRVTVQFTLTDSGDDSAEVAVEYTIDGGLNWNPALLVGQITPQPAGPFVAVQSPRLYAIEWDALADLQTSAPMLVELRLTPSGFGASPPEIGVEKLSGIFTVVPNQAPEISDFQVYQQSGNISVRLGVLDINSDDVEIEVTAFWNAGANSLILTQSDFVQGDLSSLGSSISGEDNILIWNTTRAGNPLATINAADVYWEITATDQPQSFPGAALTGAVYTSVMFPIINNSSGLTPVSIALSEATGAVTVQASQTRNFTAQISPPSASNHNVVWTTVEGQGTLTPVSSPAQGPQTVTYTAPGVIPIGGPGYVTIRATSVAAPAVVASYRLYWGAPPTGVNVTPGALNVVLNQVVDFTASVLPGGAPQVVVWQVLGGAQNGSITQAGSYTAPSTIPGTGPSVTIRAISVISGVFGDALVNLQAFPSSLVVTTGGVGGFTGPSQVSPTASLQFFSQVNPANASQAVFWTIDWPALGNSQGSGTAAVGFITAGGLYTAPASAPSPSQVFIRARSQVTGSVTDDYQVELIAPNPTSFQITPSSAIVSAGGAGVGFLINLATIAPPGANPTVNWTLSPPFGNIDATGFYTPPPNSGTTTIVTITATSTVSSTFANASVTVTPNTMVAPVSVSVTPTDARSFVAGRTLQFMASVLPSGAAQSVIWSVINGGGSINATGVYTPPVSGQFDIVVRIRATSSVDTNLSDEVNIELNGNGSTTINTNDAPMGRNDPYGFYQPGLDSMFFLGGHSEATFNLTPSKHDDLCFQYDLNSDIWKSLSRFSPAQAANTISCCYDSTRNFLYAFVGNGTTGTNPIGVYRLNVGIASPTWAAVSPTGSGGGNSPILNGTGRALCMFSDVDDEIWISLGTTLYRLDVSASPPDWQSKRTNVTGTPSTPDTVKCTYFYDAANSLHTVIGTAVIATIASTKVWTLNESSFKWDEVVTSGPGPANGLDDASSIFHNTAAWVYGGREPGGVYKDVAYWLDTSTSTYSWSAFPLTGLRTPQARGRAAVVNVGSDVFVYGGKNLVGMFGDVWKIDLFTGTCSQPSPEGIKPQGRKAPAATWVDGIGAGFVYGGICDYGVSDELWYMAYDSGKSAIEWLLIEPSMLSTTAPPQLQGASLVDDTTNSRLLLFGGNRSASGALLIQNNTYVFDYSTNAWSALSPTGTKPAARLNHSACFDSINSRMIIFGGLDNTASPFRSDVHFLNVASASGNWVQPSVVAGSIDGRMNAFAGVDATGTRMVVLGGYTQAAGATLQLYEFEFLGASSGFWTAIPTHAPMAPKTIVPGAGAWDPVGERFLTAPPGFPDNQALVHCHQVVPGNPAVTWQSLTVGGVLHGIAGVGMYDPSEKRFYAFGGDVDMGGSKFRKINQVRSVRFQ